MPAPKVFDTIKGKVAAFKAKLSKKKNADETKPTDAQPGQPGESSTTTAPASAGAGLDGAADTAAAPNGTTDPAAPIATDPVADPTKTSPEAPQHP